MAKRRRGSEKILGMVEICKLTLYFHLPNGRAVVGDVVLSGDKEFVSEAILRLNGNDQSIYAMKDYLHE